MATVVPTNFFNSTLFKILRGIGRTLPIFQEITKKSGNATSEVLTLPFTFEAGSVEELMKRPTQIRTAAAEQRYYINLYIGYVLGHTFEVCGERRADSGEQRAESGEHRAESGERRAESGDQRAES